MLTQILETVLLLFTLFFSSISIRSLISFTKNETGSIDLIIEIITCFLWAIYITYYG